LPAIAGSQHVVFYFMCRFTCSRCWRTAMVLAKLNKQLLANNTTVVLVGDDRYIEPASRLAAELELPFPLLADKHGTLRRIYGMRRPNSDCCHGALVLVDLHGAVRFGHECASAEASVNITNLLAAVEELRIENAQRSH